MVLPDATGIHAGLAGDKGEGVPQCLKPDWEVLFNLAGPDPGMAGTLKIVQHKNVHTKERSLPCKRIQPAERASGAVHQNHCRMDVATLRRVMIDVNLSAGA